MYKASFQQLAVFNGGEKLLNLNHGIVLKFRREFGEQSNHSLEFFIRCLKKHTLLAGFKPGFTYPKSKRNEVDNPVIDPPVVAFQFGDIAVADENGLGKLHLGQVECLSDLFDTLVYGHKASIEGKSSLFKANFPQNELTRNSFYCSIFSLGEF